MQVSSQRSEAEAQAAFRALQAKYPTQLGSREPIIRRADLGDKGIYYRALVGPFASMEQAAGVCSQPQSRRRHLHRPDGIKRDQAPSA